MELLVGCIILFVIFFIPWWVKRYFYKRTTYYAITQTPLSQLNKGSVGEYLIYKKLKRYEKQGGKFLFNLYLPTTRNGTTEVDVVLIHPKGFFVLESKNYAGWIFGNEVNRTWTQVLPKGRGRDSNKEKFQNPIRQNATHIKYLKRIVGETVPMWSVIVFGDDCTFKDMTVSTDVRFKVTYLHKLKSVVSRIIKNPETDAFSQQTIERMYSLLYPYTQVSDEIKREHIESIRNRRW